MPKSVNQKLKLLYILKILKEQTDEDHPMQMPVLIQNLANYGITAERKSIYTDIQGLNDFGYDINYNKSRENGGYFIGSRDFELPELKLLVDAVQSSRFITKSKSQMLIKKIEKLASKQDAGQLQRQVFVTNRVKTANESIYYTVDEIHRAIQSNHQISFLYMEWNIEKKLIARKEGKRYLISPWALLWKEENYYLIGYENETGMIKHYRVDKIGKIENLPEKRLGEDTFDQFDLAAYSNKTFGMYGGEEELVTLRMHNRLAGVAIDRFGTDISFQKINDKECRIRIRVVVSSQFFGWLTGLGNEIVMEGPIEVKEQYRDYLTKIAQNYK